MTMLNLMLHLHRASLETDVLEIISYKFRIGIVF